LKFPANCTAILSPADSRQDTPAGCFICASITRYSVVSTSQRKSPKKEKGVKAAKAEVDGMINTTHITIPQSVLGDNERYSDLCFIYALAVDNIPFYIGSTVEPCKRYLSHLALHTKDTKDKIAELAALGTDPEMILIDVTTKSDRLILESYWIDRVSKKHPLTNTSRYLSKLQDYQVCPTCYRSQRLNTFEQN
jgi:hypothetical protein